MTTTMDGSPPPNATSNIAAPILDVYGLDHFFVSVLYNKARSILLQFQKERQEITTTRMPYYRPIPPSQVSSHDGNDDNDDNNDDDILVWLGNQLAYHYRRHNRFWQVFLQQPNWLWAFVVFVYLQQSRLATPAAQLLGLQHVTTTTTTTTTRPHPRPPPQQIWKWALLAAGMPLVHGWLRDWVEQLKQQQQQQPNNDTVDSTMTSETIQLAQRRKLAVAQACLQIMERVGPLWKLSLLLWQGWMKRSSTTTNPFMVLAGLTYTTTLTTTTTSTSPPRLQVDFAHRRCLWKESLRTARLWLLDGLSMMHIWKTRDLLAFLPSFLQTQSFQPLTPVDQDRETCPCCQALPILVPLQMSCCGQWYCYTCWYAHLRQERRSSNPHSACRVCHQPVSRTTVQRVPAT